MSQGYVVWNQTVNEQQIEKALSVVRQPCHSSGRVLIERGLRQRPAAVYAFFREGLACRAIRAFDKHGVGWRGRREGSLLGVGSLNS